MQQRERSNIIILLYTPDSCRAACCRALSVGSDVARPRPTVHVPTYCVGVGAGASGAAGARAVGRRAEARSDESRGATRRGGTCRTQRSRTTSSTTSACSPWRCSKTWEKRGGDALVYPQADTESRVPFG